MKFAFDLKEEYKELHDFLSQILKDDQLLKHVASKSYKHVLGFDKIVLKKNLDTGDKLALHIWWPGSIYMDDDIHNHRWNFSSLVLKGRMLVTKYVRNPTGKVYYQYRHVSSQETESYNISDDGQERVIVSETLNVEPGDQYFHAHDDLHHIVRKDDFVVTLFTQSPPEKQYSNILTLKPIESKALQVSTTRMSPEYLSETLSKLLEALFNEQLLLRK